MRDELSERLDLHWYGGHDAVIPPRAVKEAGIESVEDFEEVMEVIFEGSEDDRYAVMALLKSYLSDRFYLKQPVDENCAYINR